jgi:AcrR family transcriptional regulator
MKKMDRQVQRTRELLQKALIDLIGERHYDAITVQDIVDRANVGRTTFYLHYTSKDELFMSCHEAIVSEFHFGPLYPLSRTDLLAIEPPLGMVAVYRHLKTAQGPVSHLFQSKDSLLLLRRIRDWNAQKMKASLHAAFSEADSTIPFDVLANYLAGAQIAQVQWWLEKCHSYTPENLAQAFHELRRAAIRSALGLKDRE